jgi:hypothetical protein
MMNSNASPSGLEHANPSAMRVEAGNWVRHLFSKESAIAGAWSDATPTIAVGNPSAARAAMNPQTPEPRPIGM